MRLTWHDESSSRRQPPTKLLVDPGTHAPLGPVPEENRVASCGPAQRAQAAAAAHADEAERNDDASYDGGWDTYVL